MNYSASEPDSYLDYINKLPGVISANIVQADNEISEVHILSDISRSPKQIVRDIQSLFMAKFKIELDHRIISVAQIDFATPNVAVARLVIEEVCVSKKRNGTEVTVVLSYQDNKYSGTQSSSSDKLGTSRAVAQATLDAASFSRDSSVKLTVLDVRFVEIADDTVALVCVSYKTTTGITCRFTGSAFIGDDEDTAIVKACLCAINRKICAY